MQRAQNWTLPLPALIMPSETSMISEEEALELLGLEEFQPGASLASPPFEDPEADPQQRGRSHSVLLRVSTLLQEPMTGGLLALPWNRPQGPQARHAMGADKAHPESPKLQPSPRGNFLCCAPDSDAVDQFGPRNSIKTSETFFRPGGPHQEQSGRQDPHHQACRFRRVFLLPC